MTVEEDPAAGVKIISLITVTAMFWQAMTCAHHDTSMWVKDV